jgi:ubiquinone/menaquinone biosynthesis C-methylase UbiE
MTDEQLQVARNHIQEYTAALGFSKPNMQFVKGYIENLAEAGIQNESVDMIISNCVVNLSPDKPSVIREAYRVLANGGEFYFSDVYCDRRLPKAVQQHEVCLRLIEIACLASPAATWYCDACTWYSNTWLNRPPMSPSYWAGQTREPD